MTSNLMWGVALSLVCASAVRRAGKVEDMSVSAGLEHIQSLLEQHTSSSKATKAAVMLRSLQEMAATPGALGNLRNASERLQQNVVDKILSDSRATQQAINRAVRQLGNAAPAAREKKYVADKKDGNWNHCLVEERGSMEKIVQYQDIYNKETLETVAPCQREIDTESFTHTSAALTVECDLVADPDCSGAFASFNNEVAAAKSTMKQEVNASVEVHVTAEQDCEAANNSQTLAKEHVVQEQDTWEHKHSLCLEKGVLRAATICKFGTKLQIACDKFAAYNDLIGDVEGTGNPMSVSDRKDELEVGELVICLLNSFVNGTDISEDVINGCSQHATNALSQLDLKLKKDRVDSIVRDDHVHCEDGTEISFDGSVWDSPMPTDGLLPRPPQLNQVLPLPIPTFENKSLPEYVSREWKATFRPEGEPFSIC